MTQWHIALIEPQGERIACHVLRARGYEAYYPTFPKKTERYYGHVRTIYRPMFPGYLFVFQHPKGWDMLRTAPGVRTFNSLLMINGRYAVLPRIEIERIAAKETELTCQILNPPPRQLPYGAGDRIKIVHGAWADCDDPYATIETLDDEQRIALLKDICGRQVRIFASHAQLAAT